MRGLRGLSVLLALLACGTDPGPVTATFLFQSLAAQANTDTIHVYALKTKGEDDCGDLIADVADPLDTSFERRGDVVIVFSDGEEEAKIEEVPAGKYLVYAEASNVVGETILAGCGEVTVDGATRIELILSAPGTFDCADPDTQNGAPCDDGEYCTTGEACNNGNCVGGGPRNCAYLENDCNGSECSEALGCQPVKAPDNSPCEDGVFCTGGDTCHDGECISGTGSPDCSLLDTECGVGVCDVDIDDCVREADEAACNEDPCQIGTCNISFSCNFVPYECPPITHPCLVEPVACINAGGIIQCWEPANENMDCDDQCWTGGKCDADGNCTDDGSATPVTPGTEGPMGNATCTDAIDNDCDMLIDGFDPDCQ